MLVRLPASVTWEELVSAGHVGLVEAADRFDAERANNFSAFARPRIRGAMLDSLRELDLLPRSTRQQINELTQARDTWTNTHGQLPSDQELADVLSLPIERVRELERYHRQTQLVHFDAPQGHDDDSTTLLDHLTDEQSIDASQLFDRNEAQADIRHAFDSLPERLRMIIVLYYVEELTMREIAELMSLSVGRISQLHTESVEELRDALTTVSDIDPQMLAVLFVTTSHTDT